MTATLSSFPAPARVSQELRLAAGHQLLWMLSGPIRRLGSGLGAFLGGGAGLGSMVGVVPQQAAAQAESKVGNGGFQ